MRLVVDCSVCKFNASSFTCKMCYIWQSSKVFVQNRWRFKEQQCSLQSVLFRSSSIQMVQPVRSQYRCSDNTHTHTKWWKTCTLRKCGQLERSIVSEVSSYTDEQWADLMLSLFFWVNHQIAFIMCVSQFWVRHTITTHGRPFFPIHKRAPHLRVCVFSEWGFIRASNLASQVLYFSTLIRIHTPHCVFAV